MEKVKVNKELFDALEESKNKGWYFENKEKYLKYMTSYKLNKSFDSNMSCLNELELQLFLKAISFGYELELSREEKVLIYYENLKKNRNISKNLNEKRELNNLMEVIKIILDNLEIYIEGINK